MSAQRPPLTVVLIAQDEADRIGAALDSVAFADTVLVVDGGSRDTTMDVARSRGARVVEHPWPGYVAQKNFAASLVERGWVLSIDADERVDPELARSITEMVAHAPDDLAGATLDRRMIYLGRAMRGSGFWPDRRLRLVRAGAGRWEGEDPHDRLCVDGRLTHLRGELRHESYRDLRDHLVRMHRHARTWARSAHARGRRTRWWDLWLRPPAYFVWRLVAGRGYRDGWRGVVACGLGACYWLLRFTELRLLDEPVPDGGSPVLSP